MTDEDITYEVTDDDVATLDEHQQALGDVLWETDHMEGVRSFMVTRRPVSPGR